MSASTDEMYNEISRYLHQKYIIHFPNMDPLVVTAENYLISADLVEETYKVSTSPFGELTSNELSFSLYNENKMFSPGNPNSPYYNKIKRGIKIEAFIRPDEVTEWDPLGVFYVTSWSVSSAGTSASVVANDALYKVLNAPVPSMIAYRNVSFSQFMEDFFGLFNLSVSVDESIQLTIPRVFTSGYSDNRSLLKDMLIAALADCYCDHTGNILITSKVASRPLRATLTDDDQIKTVELKQTIDTDYDSAIVTYNMWQESPEKELISINDFEVQAGVNITESLKFYSAPVASVKSVRSGAKPTTINATADNITVTLQSAEDLTTDLVIIGTALDNVESTIYTIGSAGIEINSKFVQTKNVANDVCDYADTYVKASMPSLNLTTRGNPLLNLGDKVLISSSYYAVTYTGIITKAKYSFIGGLTCELSLIIVQE